MSTVIIIGAPRSGTNMLRDVLTSLPGLKTWPCDEINYIWRHGNVRYPTDELPRECARPAVIRYIRRKFDEIRRRTSAAIVVEKTCANCLRIPFVDACVPDAQYIYIYRDGIDATGSGLLRWTGTLDIPYILAKARYVPLSDLPYYAVRYLFARAYRLFSADGRLSSWGPAIEGMTELLKTRTLNEVCALQWQRCVELAEAGLSTLPHDRIHRVRYEDFVASPLSELQAIGKFLDLRHDDQTLASAVEGVSGASVGKGRLLLGHDQVEHLERLVRPTLERYGYL